MFREPEERSGCSRRDGGCERLGWKVTLRMGISVHNHISQEIEQLRRPVAAGLEREELRRRVDQRRRRLAAPEFGME